MKLWIAAVAVPVLAIVDFRVYEAEGGLDCTQCSVLADVTGFAFLPLVGLSAVLLLIATARAAVRFRRRRSR